VNRAARKCNSVGGKGQNFAIACSQYGEGDKVTVFQATGGMTGQYISAYLDELNIEHVTSMLY
jgi:fructose-1-phosphate kinase PfkB-like protein